MMNSRATSSWPRCCGKLMATLLLLLGAVEGRCQSVRLQLPGTVPPGFQDYTGLFNIPEAAREVLSKVKVGMTRGEVKKLLEPNGGIYSRLTRHHFVPNVMVDKRRVMVALRFQPATMPDMVYEDPVKRHGWMRAFEEEADADNPLDVVREIGVPYLSYVAID